MRLSEAIRLGAMLKPQAFGMLFDGAGTCAFGAAADAIGELSTSRAQTCGVTTLLTRHPDWDISGRCPEGCFMIVSPGHLNDTHRWSRERIADWVESIENMRSALAVEETAKETVTC